MKKIICMLLSACLFVSMFPIVQAYGAESNDILSDRQCAILSVLTYSNNQNNINEVSKDKEFMRRCAKTQVLQSELSGFSNVDSVINLQETAGSSFSVNTYKKGDDIVIAFRGTDEGIVLENYTYLLSTGSHEQAKYAKQYIDDLKNKDFINENTKIYITGHSLGGYLAMYATAELLYKGDLSKNFVKCVTFNGLGISVNDPSYIHKTLKNLDNTKLINYRIHGDIVSQMGKHFTPFINLDMIPKDQAMSENPHKMAHFLGQQLSRELSTPDKNGDDNIVVDLFESVNDFVNSLVDFINAN